MRYIPQIHEIRPVLDDDDDSVSDDIVQYAASGHVSAWVYLLHSFKPAMLQLPTLESYSAAGDHGLPYLPRYLRDKPGHEYWTDVKQLMSTF